MGRPLKKKVKGGESPEGKDSVELKAPSPAINLTESTESNIEVPAESGIFSNVLEAGSTLHKGGDNKNFSPQHAITTLAQFPSWHAHKKKLHVELYKRFQKLGNSTLNQALIHLIQTQMISRDQWQILLIHI